MLNMMKRECFEGLWGSWWWVVVVVVMLVLEFAENIRASSEQLKKDCLEKTSIDYMKNSGHTEGSLRGSHEEEKSYRPNGLIFNPKVINPNCFNVNMN